MDNAIGFEVMGGAQYQYILNGWNEIHILDYLDAVVLDTHNGWRAAENGYRIQIAGKYIIMGGIWCEGKPSGSFRPDIVVNGSIVRLGQCTGLNSGTTPLVDGLINLNYNDLVQLSACAQGSPSPVGVAWPVTYLQGFCVGL